MPSSDPRICLEQRSPIDSQQVTLDPSRPGVVNLRFGKNQHRLQIPGDAFDRSAELTAAEYTFVEHGNRTTSNVSVVIEVRAADGSRDLPRARKSATLTLRYGDCPREPDLDIVWVEQDRPLRGRHDPQKKHVTADVDHFSTYTLAAPD